MPSLNPQDLTLAHFPQSVGIAVTQLEHATKNAHGSFHFYLVGGVVRDVLLGIADESTDIDIAFQGDYQRLIQLLEADERFVILQLNPQLHTARVEVREEGRKGKVSFDLAQLRAETYTPDSNYPQPTFNNIPIEWDLARRDFSVNAMAFDVTTGKLLDPFNGYQDLCDKLIRVLHNDSFTDDTTRIDRARKFAARLGFTIEPNTALLMED